MAADRLATALTAAPPAQSAGLSAPRKMLAVWIAIRCSDTLAPYEPSNTVKPFDAEEVLTVVATPQVFGGRHA